MFISLGKIQTYIKACEQQRLNLEAHQISKAYLPATRATETKVITRQSNF